MKALIVREHGPIENLMLEDVPDPLPGPGEVLVDVHAASVNFPDLLVIGGTYQILPKRPFSPGKDMAGLVAAVGAGVTTCKPGDRVAAQNEYGAYAQKCVVPQNNCYPMPDNMSFADAAAMGIAYPTAHFALVERGQYQPGETVLINGAAGGVGIATIQVAKALGGRVVAVTSSPSKVDRLRELGADDVVVAQGRDYWEAIVKATNGGPQVVLDNVGHPDLFSPIFRSLARKARYVFTGQVYREKIDLYPAFLFGKETQIRGAGPGGMADFADSLKLVSEGKVTPVIDPMSLDDAVEANRRLDASDFLGRGVLVP